MTSWLHVYTTVNIYTVDYLCFVLQVYIYPVILIIEILGLMLYSSQKRFRFTQIRGISIISLIFGLFLLLAYRLNRMMEVFSAMACTVEAWYIIYDTHYMLCGRHGYNIGPEEFVYAACNIHCDLPKGMWRLMKMLFFSKIVEAVRMFRECFRTEVCWWQLSWLENYLFFRLSTSCQNSSIKPFYLKTCQYFFKAYQNQRLVQRLEPSRKCCWGMLANILAGPG